MKIILTGNKRKSIVIGRKQNPQDDLTTLTFKQKYLMPNTLKPLTSKSKSPNIQHRSKRFKKEKSPLSKFVSKTKKLQNMLDEKRAKKKPTLEKKKYNLIISSQETIPKNKKINMKKMDHHKKNSLKYPKDYVYEISNHDVKKECKC